MRRSWRRARSASRSFVAAAGKNKKKTRRLRRVFFFPLAITSALAVTTHAQEQPNPNRFPAAGGATIPILEGYWAASQDACAKLQLTNEIRPHVGLKSFPIANSESFPAYTFQYLGPRLGNWPDGLCHVLSIKRETGGRFLVGGYCGSEARSRYRREDQFSGVVTVQNERRILISAQGVVPAGEFFFCKSVPAKK